MNDTLEERLALAARLWDWHPHEGQRAFLALRLPDGSEPGVLVAACGRRWGKTECLGMDVAARILLEPELGQMGVAPTRDQAEALFDSVEEKIADAREAAREDAGLAARFPHLLDLEVKRAPFPQIRRRSDGRRVFWVRAAGRSGRNLRGRGTTRRLTRFRVIVDERAFVSDEAVESALKPMLATVPGGGGQLVEISSPNGRRGGFYDDFVKGEREYRRYRAVRLPSAQNPLVDREYLAEMAEEMTPARFRQEFLAEFVEAAGAVFPEADVDAALCDDDYGDAPLWGRTYVAGVDFGRRGDFTVLAVLEVGPLAARLVAFRRLPGLGWDAQVAAIAETLKHWGCRIVVPDATGVGDAVTDILVAALAAGRVRCRVEPFVFTGASKGPLIDALAIALSQRRLRFPAHPVLVSELGNFEAVPSATPGGREKLQAAKGHDDAVCALALATHAAAPWLVKQMGGPVKVSAGGSRRREGAERAEFAWSDSVLDSGGGPRAAYSRSLGRWQGRLLWRLLNGGYRCEAGRRAGAKAELCWRAFLERLLKRRWVRTTRRGG